MDLSCYYYSKNLQQPHIERGITLGRGVLKALGMGDGFTHMEWYLTPKGEVVFGEIGCRPGGAHLVDQMNFTSDIDLFREWARAVCWKDVHITQPRKYNVAIVFKRAMGSGRIQNITGLHNYLKKYGKQVMVENLLKPGQHRRDWKQTLVSDGFLILRHPNWEITKHLAEKAGIEIQLIPVPTDISTWEPDSSCDNIDVCGRYFRGLSVKNMCVKYTLSSAS